MKPRFELSIKSIEAVHEVPGTWSEQDCSALLKQLEFDDVANIPPDQLREYATMALQDLEDDEAAGALIDHVFGDSMSDGQKQNLAEEMTRDRCWEEYPDLSFHERIFNAQFLLNLAYPGTPRPEVQKIKAVLSSLNQAAETCLARHGSGTPKGIPEGLILRCLAAALPPGSILSRLFEDQIKGEAPFHEAESILWHVLTEALPAEGARRQRHELTLYTPSRWTESLEEEVVIECEPFVRDFEEGS